MAYRTLAHIVDHQKGNAMLRKISGGLLLGLLVLLGLAACSGEESPAANVDELLSLPDDQPTLLFFFSDG